MTKKTTDKNYCEDTKSNFCDVRYSPLQFASGQKKAKVLIYISLYLNYLFILTTNDI